MKDGANLSVVVSARIRSLRSLGDAHVLAKAVEEDRVCILKMRPPVVLLQLLLLRVRQRLVEGILVVDGLLADLHFDAHQGLVPPFVIEEVSHGILVTKVILVQLAMRLEQYVAGVEQKRDAGALGYSTYGGLALRPILWEAGERLGPKT